MKVAVGESNRQAVIVPPGVVHAYKNIGSTPGWVFNAPNRLYAGPGKRSPVDEIRHEEQAGQPVRVGLGGLPPPVWCRIGTPNWHAWPIIA